nr:MAG TPA: hypothetical protein [Caudoviricetes sp.]
MLRGFNSLGSLKQFVLLSRAQKDQLPFLFFLPCRQAT